MTITALTTKTRELEAGASDQRLVTYLAERLEKLCIAAGFGSGTSQVIETFRSLLQGWGDRPLGASSEWVSEISDDNTPVEFSATIADGAADVRVLLEPQADLASVSAYRAAGLALHERLEREFGASLRRFREVQDLFLPESMCGPYAVWSSAVFSRKHQPFFKTYFNPQAQGVERAPALVQEALDRLGFHKVWDAFEHTAMRRGPYLDELKYFGLDLTDEAHARVKLYVLHHGASPEDLEIAASSAKTYVPGEAVEFATAMRGGSSGPLRPRAPFSCSAFVGEQHDRPAATTVSVPICAYAHDDAAVRERIRTYLIEKDRPADAALYASIVDGFANRPLEAGVGLQVWVTYRRYMGQTRLTIYLATEANKVYAPGAIPAPTPDRLNEGG